MTKSVRVVIIFLIAIVYSLYVGCEESAAVDYNYEFHSPQPVIIVGYSSHAMEPFISRDGQYLFFNNSNDPSVNTNLHYAQRVNDTTFQYMGEISGVNTDSLDGVASMDTFGNFYFITTRSYYSDTITVYGGVFDSGVVTDVEPIGQNLTLNELGWLEMDAEVSPSGNTLYFARAFFSGGDIPDSSNLFIAAKDGSQFVVSGSSDDIMENINTENLEYAASITTDELELFFTRADMSKIIPEMNVMIAKRSSVTEPFGEPQIISAIEGENTEAPSITSDGKNLYFHKKVNGVFSIFMVSR
jgi:Tol biopolymer transport system component